MHESRETLSAEEKRARFPRGRLNVGRRARSFVSANWAGERLTSSLEKVEAGRLGC